MIQLASTAAMWFLPFVVPICLYTCWSDMRDLRIPNYVVITLALVFVFVGLVALPLPDYPWRLLQALIALVIVMLLNAAGVMGGGDAKFIAAAAPFIHPGDLKLMIPILCTAMLAAYVAHRIAKHSPIRRMVPDWKSWDSGKKFPMGLALGGALTAYLVLAAIYGQS